MRKIFTFFLVVVFTDIIFAPVSLNPSVQTEVEITSVIPMKKVPLPRPFFRLEGTFKVTNYVPRKGAKTSTGKIAKWGIVAVNPEEIPLGSIVYISDFPGKRFVADDTIGKKGIRAGVKIDICRNWNYPHKHAKVFGGKKRRVTIIKPSA